MQNELGSLLQDARKRCGLTLRAVEESTGRRVKNSYLSQVENGRIGQPSPDAIYELSQLYGLPYADVMVIAGYQVPVGSGRDSRLSGAGVLLEAELSDLSDEEIEDILAVVRVIKDRKNRSR